MKRSTLILFGIAIATFAAFVLAACDEEPTQAEANEQFCDATADYIAALRDIRDLDRNSSVQEFQSTRDQVSATYDQLIDASAEVVSVRLDELNEARDDLQAAIDDVPEDATLGEALGAVDDEVDNVVREVGQVLNDVDCSLETGDDSQSDE